MKISFLVVGKTNVDYLKTGIEQYAKRLKHYANFKLEVIPDVKRGKKKAIDWLKQQEGQLILQQLQNSDFVVLLDENGKQFSSLDFSKYIEGLQNRAVKQVKFVVGGAYGFSEPVYKRANAKMSLSKMTFSHQMIRLLFVEQLYRAYSIIHNEPYHHK